MIMRLSNISLYLPDSGRKNGLRLCTCDVHSLSFLFKFERASHSCFSFLLQISSKPFSVKDYKLIQYLIPVPVSLRPLFDYVLAGKIQHLFQCRIAWEYAFRFRDFPILAVQSFYDICRVHNASDIIRKLKKGTYIFPIIFPVTDRVRIFLPPFFFHVFQLC